MISIITPVYNREHIIEECIQTVIDQNYPHIEHIIIDGSSTDNTPKIIEKYARQYSHIRWLSEPDKGQSDAMNRGLLMAKGEIIGFLNSDDYYEPNVFKKVDQYFRDLPIPSLLVANCNVWHNNNQLINVNKPRELNLSDLLLGFHVNPFPINPSAYFYHKFLHELIGLYDVNEHYVLDVDFLFRAVQVANIEYVDETWGNYRQFENTKTVESINSGKSTQRVERLIRKYRKSFSYPSRLKLMFQYGFYKQLRTFNNFWKKLYYYLQNPSLAWSKINEKRKL